MCKKNKQILTRYPYQERACKNIEKTLVSVKVKKIKKEKKGEREERKKQI